MDWFKAFLKVGLILMVVGIGIVVGLLLVDITTVNILTAFENRDKIVQECLLSERYTREECILLAGGE